MSEAIATGSAPPPLRRGLIVRPAEAEGQFVVKDAAHGTYFHVGEQEYFLFNQLDGRQSGEEICAAFEQRFRDPLTADDLQDFVKLAARRGLLQGDDWAIAEEKNDEDLADFDEPAAPHAQRRLKKQSLLRYRVPFFNPDRLLTAMEPRLRFLWTQGFLVVSVLLISLAAWLTFANWQEWLSAVPRALTWQTLAWAWVTIFIVSMIHEFAHGLTCKHFGGEVHEIGFLMLYGMPCFYCNVSDAWLFRERWKRLWVGLAGPFCDLVLWALATLVWRLTMPQTGIYQAAWLWMSVCGGGCFFNFNPLVKLDGYYLLSDATGMPNLSSRGRKRWFKTLGWLAWGGSRPAAEPHSRFLLLYGLASWLFIGSLLCGLVLNVVGVLRLEGAQIGYLGTGLSLLMSAVIGRNVFKGVFAGEFTKMLSKRRGRAMLWAGALIGGPLLISAIPFYDRAPGTFRVRPSTRVEINALEAGFLQEITLEEGSRVSPGTPIARIHIPDLEVNIIKKLAEIRESEANLRRLEAGPRPEEIAQQRQRVIRDEAWRDLGKLDLARATRAFNEEINRLDRQIAQHAAEVEFNRQSLENAQKLHAQNALSGEQLLGEKTKSEVKSLEFEEARAQKRSREAEGTGSAESELARREKELADQRSVLTLLEAGGRPEEIEAERARLARLHEERKYLEGLRSRVVLCSPVAGVITTPHLKEKNGQFVPQGTVICVVEELSDVVAEIAVQEDDEFAVQPGQRVELRARAIPFRTFEAKVERKAPSAVVAVGQLQGTVTVYCRLAETDAGILSGMTGHARIYQERRPLGLVLARKALKYLRTEFWWW
jgi:putative peptide zinc metalloprotease protein